MSATILPFPGSTASPEALATLLAIADHAAWADQHLPLIGLAVEVLNQGEDDLIARTRQLMADDDGKALIALTEAGLPDTQADLVLFADLIAAARARLAIAAARVALQQSTQT